MPSLFPETGVVWGDEEDLSGRNRKRYALDGAGDSITMQGILY